MLLNGIAALWARYLRVRRAASTATLNHFTRTFCHVNAAQYIDVEPVDAAGIITRAKFSALNRTIKIDKHVVILALPFRILYDAFEDCGNRVRRHAQASLFEDLSYHRIFQPLARFNRSARQRPATCQRLIAAFHQQHPSAIQNQGPHAQHRTRRIAAAVTHIFSLRRLIPMPDTLAGGVRNEI